MITYKEAILIDARGFVLGGIRWPANQPPPEFNKPRKGQTTVRPEDRKYLLTDQYAIDNVRPDARWDFKPVRNPETGAVTRSGTWRFPTEIRYLVDNRNGRLAGERYVWPDNMPVPPRYYIFVETTPPKSRSRRPIWTGTEWVFPRRVALLTPAGELAMVQLENPREDQPNVEVPPGWERFDDDAPWPEIAPGIPVGPGDRRNGQAWERPTPQN